MGFPFTAVCGHREFRHCLILCAVDPGIGGVLALGDRGTGKSTTIRALAELIPGAPVVDLPLGASVDRLVGGVDIDAALLRGEVVARPGLMAQADGGFLYVDEVNLLEDHLVDLLLDAAASGQVRLERDGLSQVHPSRFVLVGSGNPEEGGLRPQLQDRFGLSTHVSTILDRGTRAQIVRRRLAYDADPAAFELAWAQRQEELRHRVAHARSLVDGVAVGDAVLDGVVEVCVRARAVGHRAEVVLMRAARAHAAWRGGGEVTPQDVADVALPVLRHRVPQQRGAADHVRSALVAALPAVRAA